ncbi:amidase [Kaistella jeonii]|uniref:Amidase n=1 Tax=Kaistella jeonii TaxID=266749 RepID=A0A0C1FG05_9FLAO|nr:amidase [Kaistella jeonii]KIA90733.1 amidase [Kaistella jeonii]SFB68565.1 amidase [Kaistella jeonii]VEI94651.1 Glutamyl-tRNA(Gln) amidotransferase subunit A [Kaistella jeonii]
MKRSDFLKNTALATIGIPTLLAANSFTENKKDPKQENPVEESHNNFELDEMTVLELQDKMEKGIYTSAQITQLYLDRIEAIDENGPKLNSMIEVNPEALSIAKAMDQERKEGNVRGPLHGIPVVIKDNIDTEDKMMTTAGALALVGHIAEKDAFIVTQLRNAGAVILGKTNLSEWANFRSTNSSSGWSSRGLQTKNPYILDHSPCGSSAGSGSAVSANLCAIAVGTETDGSVTCPASINGAVGIKPTVGLVSRSGIIPISSTQDTAGPLTRTVTDAAILLEVLAGVDKADLVTHESRGKNTNYTQFLNKDGLNGKRIGVEKKKYANQFLNELQEKALDVLKKQGATIVELVYLDSINALGSDELKVLKYEFKNGVNNYLSNTNAKMKNLAAVIKFNKDNEDAAMPTFKQELLEESETKKDLKDPAYIKAVKNSHIGSKKIIDDVMKKNNLDAITGLTIGPACSIDVIYGDKWGEVSLTAPAAMSCYPHISVPCGKVYDLPVGLSFFSSAYREGEIISLAYAFEQATKHRVKPEFKKSFLA